MPIPWQTCCTLAPTDSQTEATALMKEIFIARNALEACLISSALLVLVTIKGGGICARSGPRNRILVLVITAIGQRRINRPQHRRAAFIVGADHDAVGIEKIRDRRSFPQKFGIGGHIKRIRRRRVAQNNFANPVARIDRNRTLLDYNFVTIDRRRRCFALPIPRRKGRHLRVR